MGKNAPRPYEKGSTLKGKNLLPLGANAFLLKQISFQNGLGVRITKVAAFVINKVEHLSSSSSSLQFTPACPQQGQGLLFFENCNMKEPWP